jgi:DNA-binding response OmpR family regulator
MSRPRILLVEDEALVAMLAEDTLLDSGFEVLGPYLTVADALAAVARGGFDAAVLDMNLGGASGGPVADSLEAAGVPFLVVTGYGPAGLPARHRAARLLTKPYEPSALVRELRALLSAPRPTPAAG